MLLPQAPNCLSKQISPPTAPSPWGTASLSTAANTLSCFGGVPWLSPRDCLLSPAQPAASPTFQCIRLGARPAEEQHCCSCSSKSIAPLWVKFNLHPLQPRLSPGQHLTRTKELPLGRIHLRTLQNFHFEVSFAKHALDTIEATRRFM